MHKNNIGQLAKEAERTVYKNGMSEGHSSPGIETLLPLI